MLALLILLLELPLLRLPFFEEPALLSQPLIMSIPLGLPLTELALELQSLQGFDA